MLDPDKIKNHCKQRPQTRELVREIHLFDSVHSTNQVALEMASTGAPGGVLILADAQEHGKGRLGREWFSPKGVNVYLSLLLRPHQPARELPLFSLATAVALVETIGNLGLKAQIKWPNDILLPVPPFSGVNEKKVAGILLESVTDGAHSPPLVVGIGVNVNLDEADFPPELRSNATSLKAVLGEPIDRNRFILSLLDTLAQEYLLLEEENKERLIERVKRRCRTLGKKVRVDTARRTFEGWAETIEEDGALLIRMGDGNRRKILVGDITHLREMEKI